MNIIRHNEELFKYMTINKFYLISSKLEKIEIFGENLEPNIELHFKLNPVNKLLYIRFNKVIEYSFYYRNGCNFYNIERCKFFKNGNYFYISIDPFNEVIEVNENDQDFILCKEIYGYIV